MDLKSDLIMATLKAPYNFVPVDKKVVIPHWGKYISHDIPFEDGISGTIGLTIEAHSPIFVRDGATKPKSENDPRPNWFAQFENTPFIPGSSLKGMIRNVLEIISFSRMKGRVNDHRYAIRDLAGPVKDLYLSKFRPNKIFCGWLQKENETYTIEDCGIPGRISHRELDNGPFQTDFSTYFLKGGGFDSKEEKKIKKEKKKSALFKYKRFGDNNRKHFFTLAGEDAGGRRIYELGTQDDPNAEFGEIVFTGQPGPRFQKEKWVKGEKKMVWTGHRLEFIFFRNAHAQKIEVRNEVTDNFFFAYFEHDKNRWSIDYKHWRKKLLKGEKIPVFFRKDDKGNILDFGLSYLYKLPYQNSVQDSIWQTAKESEIDFSDAIFGYILNEHDEEREEGLKGRVHIGHAFAKQGFQVANQEEEVLSSPKASYYPNYIRQEVGSNGKKKGNYKTFMDDAASIAGWKRYPVHNSEVKHNPKPENASDKVLTKFVPLKAGVVFEGKIRFHNLKRVELGALLSALTFHKTSDAFHSLGMAKPLGYGKVKFKLSGVEKPEVYMKEFEAYMNVRLGKPWNKSDQICELLSMACEQENKENSELSYMQLKDFQRAKNDELALNRYSHLDGIQRICAASLVQPEDIVAMKRQLEKEEQLYQQKESSKEIISRYREEQKKRFQEKLEEFKQVQIEALRNRRELVREREKQEKSEKKIEKARSGGPEWEEIDLSHRDAFEYLKKAVQQYVEDYYGNKYKKLTEEMDGGVLPKEHRQVLIEKILTVVRQASKNERKRWMKPIDKNAYLRKIREWIGREETEELAGNITMN